MKRPNEISINQFQLAFLLNDEQKNIYKFMLEKGVFCLQCGSICEKGIEVKKISLTNLNDVKVQGICKACNSKVVRIIEFGEDKIFFENANNFRKTIRN